MAHAVALLSRTRTGTFRLITKPGQLKTLLRRSATPPSAAAQGLSAEVIGCFQGGFDPYV
jgi:hypothetical protein